MGKRTAAEAEGRGTTGWEKREWLDAEKETKQPFCWDSSTESMITKSNPKLISKTVRRTRGQTHRVFTGPRRKLPHRVNNLTDWPKQTGKERRGGPGTYAAADWRQWGSGELITEAGQVCTHQEAKEGHAHPGKSEWWKKQEKQTRGRFLIICANWHDRCVFFSFCSLTVYLYCISNEPFVLNCSQRNCFDVKSPTSTVISWYTNCIKTLEPGRAWGGRKRWRVGHYLDKRKVLHN